MYNLIEYSDNYSKPSGVLQKYCKNEPLDANNALTDFNADYATTDLFKTKEKIAGKAGGNCRTDVKIMVPLKYLSNFWRTLELKLPLINCEIKIDLNWSKNCVIVAKNVGQATTFSITGI